MLFAVKFRGRHAFGNRSGIKRSSTMFRRDSKALDGRSSIIKRIGAAWIEVAPVRRTHAGRHVAPQGTGLVDRVGCIDHIGLQAGPALLIGRKGDLLQDGRPSLHGRFP